MLALQHSHKHQAPLCSACTAPTSWAALCSALPSSDTQSGTLRSNQSWLSHNLGSDTPSWLLNLIPASHSCRWSHTPRQASSRCRIWLSPKRCWRWHSGSSPKASDGYFRFLNTSYSTLIKLIIPEQPHQASTETQPIISKQLAGLESLEAIDRTTNFKFLHPKFKAPKSHRPTSTN